MGTERVRAAVARVPPEELAERYHYHPRCFDRSQDWRRE
jgi:hypothetical protein